MDNRMLALMEQQSLDPQTLALLQVMKGNSNPTVGQAALTGNVEADRLLQHQQGARQRQRSITSPIPQGLGKYAPIAGALRGFAGQMQGRADDRKQEDLYQRIQQVEAQKKEEALQIQMQTRQRQEAEAIAARQRELADAEQASQYEIKQEQAKALAKQNAAIAEYQYGLDNPEPVAPSKPSAYAEKNAAVQRANSLPPGEERNQALLMADGGDIVTHEADQVEAQETQKLKARENETALGILNKLLDPANAGAMASATGGMEGGTFGDMKNAAFNQPAVDWANAYEGFKNISTLDNMGRMSGILSDSDIKILSGAALGGISRTSGEADMKAGLEAFQRYYQAGAVPPGAYQALEANPQMIGDFEQKYGFRPKGY
jgi:hypothetical protein